MLFRGVIPPPQTCGRQQVTEPRDPQHKTAEELIPDSLKRALSYAEELAQATLETLEELARNTASPVRDKAKAMVKLIKQSERLLAKARQKGGRA